MTRIKSNNVQLGGDFFVPIEEKVRSVEISQAYSKEKAILLDAEKKAEEILAQAQAQA